MLTIGVNVGVSSVIISTYLLQWFLNDGNVVFPNYRYATEFKYSHQKIKKLLENTKRNISEREIIFYIFLIIYRFVDWAN